MGDDHGDDLDDDQLIRGVRDGDPAALREFFASYGPALQRVADRAIDPRMRRRFGPESIAQSVCRTFMRRAAADEFQLVDGDALWRLLCAIALTKVRERVRFHGRLKRDVGAEIHVDAEATFGARGGPTAEDEIAFADQFGHVLAALDDDLRRLLELRLQELTQAEIAERMECSERTVRRLLGRLEEQLTQLLDA